MSSTTVASGPTQICRVSIIIKALNEEKRIATAVQSALRAVQKVGGEVILADSCSTDQTVEIAARYPICIVQLANPAERCCGIGPQLGYQHSSGEFVYILDGDMEMLDGFLEPALAFMASNPDVVGVGGQVLEQNTESLEYRARMERASSHMQAGAVDRLDMGGLYRRSAIEKAGYFSNRNLHSYEEVDLAVRLRAVGGRLWRLPIPSVNHHGHDAPPYKLLMRRWQSLYICGLGELLRAAIGKPHLYLILRDVKELRIYAVVVFWWLFMSGVVFWPILISEKIIIFTTLLSLPFAIMVFRKRSIEKALFSVVSWCFNSIGFIRGFFRTSKSSMALIDSRKIKNIVFDEAVNE